MELVDCINSMANAYPSEHLINLVKLRLENPSQIIIIKEETHILRCSSNIDQSRIQVTVRR